MKKLFAFILLLGVFSITQYACKTTVNISKADLSGKPGMVDQLHHVINGEYSSYRRGGDNTTNINYDNLRFTFYTDGTAIHIDQYGTTYNATWKFVGDNKDALAFTINGHTDVWEMLNISGKYLYASANINISGDNNNIETFRLIQVP